MDNEAFRALVAERSRTKTTKEIAREAVEQEYRDKRSRAGQAASGYGRKRRRGQGGGGSSSDEGGGDSDEDDYDRQRGKDDQEEDGAGDEGGRPDEPKWKRERRAKRRANEEAEGKIKYRDRAKERREGRSNVDYAGTEGLAASTTTSSGGAAGIASGRSDEGGGAVLGEVDADMTKFLGGDEAHTHLVKGLDWALAQKVRREEMAAEGQPLHESSIGGAASAADAKAVDLDRLLKTSSAKRSQSEALLKAIKNLSSKSDPTEVNMVLKRLERGAQTSLGKSMATFLFSKSNCRTIRATATDGSLTTGNYQKLRVANAGRTLQRTKLQFSLRCRPGDVVHSWEVPKEEVTSLADYGRSKMRTSTGSTGGNDGPFGEKLTPLDANFVRRMKSALLPAAGTTEEESRRKKRGKKKKHKHSDGDEHDGANGDFVRERGRVGYNNGDKAKAAGAKAAAAAETTNGMRRAVSDVHDEDSSDEDIFGGVGEYVPSIPSAVDKDNKKRSAKPNDDKDKVSKGSIFLGLSGPEEPNVSALAAAKRKTPSKPKSVSFGVSAVAPSGNGKKKVIDRDVFGARPSDTSGHGKPKAAGGVSISEYSGGYGEEMDVDFTGIADEEAASDDKKKKDLTTTAATEYGKRGGRGGKSDDGGGML